MSRAARFSAYFRDQGIHTRRLMPDAECFIDAALTLAELSDCGETGNAIIVVTDCETGRERSFQIELFCPGAPKR